MIESEPDAAPGPRRSTVRLMGAVLGLQPRRALLVFLCLLVTGALELMGIGALLPAIGVLSGTVHAGAGGGSAVTQRILGWLGGHPDLGLLLAIAAIAFVAKGIVLFLVMRFVVHTSALIAGNLRRALVEAVLQARWSYFVTQPSGRFGMDIGINPESVSFSYIHACRILAAAVQALVCVVMAFTLSWTGTLAALVIALGISGLLHPLVAHTRRAGNEALHVLRSLLNTLVDSVQGMKALKAMARESRVVPLLHDDIRGLQQQSERAETSKIALRLAREPLQLLAAGIWVYAAHAWWHMSFEALAVTVLLFVQVVSRLSIIQMLYQELARFEASYWSLQDAIHKAEAAQETWSGTASPTLSRGIELKDVSFTYSDGHILHRASLAIPAGQVTAVLGPSGSGKTTLADLVTGLLVPAEGDVRVDGVPLRDIDLRAWRSRLGYVPQDPILFHDSIARNVTLDDPGLGEGDVEAVLRIAGAWDFVAAMPERLETVVGERGGRLSGGQRQRIAIARALIRKPWLLILDEATSALDPEGEANLIRSLRGLPWPLTILAVSHREAVASAADVLYEVRDGVAIRRPVPGRAEPAGHSR